jgi:hypothetical protein
MTNISDLLSALVGRTIVAVRRILYVFRGEVTYSAGPIEYTFRGGDSLWLDAAGNGYALAAFSGPWLDPFVETLSPENATFVEQCGKWTAFDVSADESFAPLIGHEITHVGFMRDDVGILIGVEIATDTLVVRAEVGRDELLVDTRHVPRSTKSDPLEGQGHGSG